MAYFRNLLLTTIWWMQIDTCIQTQQLDYILITPRLVPALQATGHLPFHTGIFLDHCTMWADFNPEIIFLGILSSSENPTL
eukprot:12206557-Ditylum_brightwellii.AAC.2